MYKYGSPPEKNDKLFIKMLVGKGTKWIRIAAFLCYWRRLALFTEGVALTILHSPQEYIALVGWLGPLCVSSIWKV